jgi:ATP-dependent Clp protease ATP-binding subunit ClpC
VFERFTERARQAVVLAQDEARALDHNYIGTEHLLLGLLREEEGLAARVLENLEIRLDDVRARVETTVGRGEGGAAGQIPFTPRAKQVLERALREALNLGHDYIGTEHVLLGLARVDDGVAARILIELGADAGTIASETASVLGGPLTAVPTRRGRGIRRRRAEPGPGFWVSGLHRWEYHVVDAEAEDLAAQLGELGRQGWELVTAVGARLVLKRPAGPGP